MDEEQKKDVFDNIHTTAAGTLKILMALMSLADEICGGIIMNTKREQGEQGAEEEPSSPELSDNAQKKIQPERIFSIINLFVSVGLSYACGFYLYSPMDVDNDSDYSKDIQRISKISAAYTYIWWIKSITSLSVSCSELLGSKLFKDKKEIVSTVCKILLMCECSISALVEISAAIEASYVTSKYTGNEKKDGGCFISDTFGFVFDDLRSILDVIFDMEPSTTVLVLRETSGALFCASQIATGSVLFTI